MRDRLARLDRRVLPTRRYDARQPLWFSFGGLIAVLSTYVLLLAARAADGLLRGVVLLLWAAVVVSLVSAVGRWDRRHRVR